MEKKNHKKTQRTHPRKGIWKVVISGGTWCLKGNGAKQWIKLSTLNMNSGKCPTPSLIPTHSPCTPAALWHSIMLLPTSCSEGALAPPAPLPCRQMWVVKYWWWVLHICAPTVPFCSSAGLVCPCHLPADMPGSTGHQFSMRAGPHPEPTANFSSLSSPCLAYSPIPWYLVLIRSNWAAKDHRSLLVLRVACGVLGCQTPCNSAWVCMGWHLISHKMTDPSLWAACVLGDRQVSIFIWGQLWRDRGLVFPLWGSFVLLLAGKQK